VLFRSAKVNAYLSGKMPSDVAEKEVGPWATTYNRVFAQTGDENMAMLAAQGAINRATILGVKSTDGGLPTEVEGWAILFTNPDELDLQDTYFDQMTDLALKYYPNAPLWYEHGRDPAYDSRIIGQRSLAKVYPCGVWVTHTLHPDDPLYPRTAQEVADGLLAYSSDSIAHHAQRGYDPADGRLGIWPFAGCSLTKTPAEPGLGPVVSAKSLEVALKSALSEREASEEHPAVPDKMKTDSEPSEEKMDPNELEPGQNGEVIEAPVEALDEALDETLNALATMYGISPADPMSVRKAMDSHIEAMTKAGAVPPELCKALGLDEKAAPAEVADHLNSMYSKATTPVPSYDYGALEKHLHSGGGAGKSAVPYMTGDATVAAKVASVNVNLGKKPPTVLETVVDIIRAGRGEKPKYGLGQKAMTSASGPTGAYVMHQEVSPTVLDPLRPAVVCNQLGATRVDMQGTSVLEQPIMNTAPAAYWVAENQALNDGQPSYRTVTMIPRGLACLVKIPWNVEANMTPQADKQLRAQMAKSMALALDYTAFLGTGGAVVSGQGTTPLGLLYIPDVQTKTFGSNGRVPTFQDINDAFGLLDDANVPFDGSSKRGIAAHSKIARSFWNATDALGNPLLRPSWADAQEKTMLATPYGISNQIPTNLTVGTRTDGSYVFVGDWQYMYIGLSNQVELRLDQTFAGNGQVGLLMYVYADIKVVYPQAFVTMKNVVPPLYSGTTNSTNS
jgi:HK97 family phage major capsid protein